MSRLNTLIKGEFSRLNRYNLFAASFAVSVIYVAMVWFMDERLLEGLLPFIFMADSTLMTSLLVGATLFYEKKEHTINSIMVTPATSDEYMMAKLVAGQASALFTVVFLSLSLYFLKGYSFVYLHACFAAMATSALHTLVGIRLAYSARSFTSMLVSLMVYALVLFFPTVLALTGVLGRYGADYIVVSPLETSTNLFRAAFSSDVPAWKIVFGYAYMVCLSVAVYYLGVKPRFSEYMMREMGV